MFKGLWFEKHNVAGTGALGILINCLVGEEQHYPKIIIESDNKIVIDAILGFSWCPWKLLEIVEDTKIIFFYLLVFV